MSASCARRLLLHVFVTIMSCAHAQAAWELFTPVLKEIESQSVAPELYPYGSRGPVGAHYLAAKYGVRWGDIMSTDDDDC